MVIVRIALLSFVASIIDPVSLFVLQLYREVLRTETKMTKLTILAGIMRIYLNYILIFILLFFQQFDRFM